MVIIIDNIFTPYEIVRYNAINKQFQGNLKVWFHARTEPNRYWKHFPKCNFSYAISTDLFNLDVILFLHNNKKKITRIIVCGWNAPIYWYTLLFALQNRIRLTLWSGSTLYERSFFRILAKPFVRYFISRCSDYIAYGTRAKKYLEYLGASKKPLSVYYNSVDVNFFHSQAKKLKKAKYLLRKKYHIPAMNTVFLFVGQLIERKSILELIDAFISVSKRYPNISLLIVGNGHLKEKIQKIIYMHLHTNIIQIDHLEYFQIPEAYAVSDALILPSKEEVWGLVVNEAMASELPVLVSERAGCSVDLVMNRTTGFVFNPTGSEIVKALHTFLRLSVDQRRVMRRKAWERVRSIPIAPL